MKCILSTDCDFDMDRLEHLAQLKSVVEYWKVFDIDNKRLVLDKQVVEKTYYSIVNKPLVY